MGKFRAKNQKGYHSFAILPNTATTYEKRTVGKKNFSLGDA